MRKTRKIIAMLTSIMMMGSLIFTGCAGKNNNDSNMGIDNTNIANLSREDDPVVTTTATTTAATTTEVTTTEVTTTEEPTIITETSQTQVTTTAVTEAAKVPETQKTETAKKVTAAKNSSTPNRTAATVTPATTKPATTTTVEITTTTKATTVESTTTKPITTSITSLETTTTTEATTSVTTSETTTATTTTVTEATTEATTTTVTEPVSTAVLIGPKEFDWSRFGKNDTDIVKEVVFERILNRGGLTDDYVDLDLIGVSSKLSAESTKEKSIFVDQCSSNNGYQALVFDYSNNTASRLNCYGDPSKESACVETFENTGYIMKCKEETRTADIYYYLDPSVIFALSADDLRENYGNREFTERDRSLGDSKDLYTLAAETGKAVTPFTPAEDASVDIDKQNESATDSNPTASSEEQKDTDIKFEDTTGLEVVSSTTTES